MLTRIALQVPAAAAEAFEAALAQVAPTVSCVDAAPGFVRLEALAETAPDPSALDLVLSLAAAATDAGVPEVAIDEPTDRDWVAASRAGFPPLRLGRFLIHANDDPDPLPPDAIGLAIDAGLAFGSGRHGSTAGCLLALDGMRRRRFRNALDIGCGSGVLALAMARSWRSPVLACDIDPAAVAVCRDNARANQVAPRVRAVVANGCRASAIAAAAPFDLVSANILAVPLRRMAGEIVAVLSPGGRLVLSGFIAAEADAVLAAYHARGLRLVRRISVDGWVTLTLACRGYAKASAPTDARAESAFCSAHGSRARYPAA